MQVSDDSKVILGSIPTNAVQVTAVCAGTEWNKTEPVITAPTGIAGNLFVLESPIDEWRWGDMCSVLCEKKDTPIWAYKLARKYFPNETFGRNGIY